MVLPGFGIISEVLPVFARKPIFGYKAIAASTVVIAFLGLLVWAHHMFATPSPTVVLVFFMMSSFLIAVPTGVKIFNWIATLWRGTIEFTTPLLFCVGFLAHVPHRRHHRHLPGDLPGRLAAAPTPTSSSPTSTTCSIGGAVFAIFAGHLLLVPEDHGPDAERGARARSRSR